MKRSLLVFALVAIGFPAFAERQWLTTEEFETAFSGRAVQLFTPAGEPFGTEFFLPKRQVVFVAAGTTDCTAGTWAPRGNLICYTYTGNFGSCVRYYREAENLVGVDWIGGIMTSNTMTLTMSPEVFPTCTTN